RLSAPMQRALIGGRGRAATGMLFTLVGAAYVGGDYYDGRFRDHYQGDRLLLRRARAGGPAQDQPYICPGDGALFPFWWMHSSRGRIQLLHNLSFLRGDRLHPTEVYVILRRNLAPGLAAYGESECLFESPHSKDFGDPGKTYALYRVIFRQG